MFTKKHRQSKIFNIGPKITIYVIVISFRENLVDEFTCDGRSYGYYADVANDCQEFQQSSFKLSY